jgi:SAM-dependent methyltransferase
MEHFVDAYLAAAAATPLEILDFGSQQVNPVSLTYRTLLDRSPWRYRGLDIEAGHNVDVCVKDAYDWPDIPSDSIDVVVSGQAFEHVEYFWASAFEIGRVLKPGGLTMLIAPSGGYEHRFPARLLALLHRRHAGARRPPPLRADRRLHRLGQRGVGGLRARDAQAGHEHRGRERVRARVAMQKALLADHPRLDAPVPLTAVPAPTALPAPTRDC